MIDLSALLQQWWFLVLLGLAVGSFGTIIGAGGGFILVPILLLLLPNAAPDQITSISLAVVFVNALSGSIAYHKQGRIDIKSAAWFALATLPGAVFGALATQWIPRHQFNIGFGILMLIASVYLLLKPESVRDPDIPPAPRHTTRTITDAGGTEHSYSFSMVLGMSISVIVGFLSSLLGIGGGIIHVPLLNRALNFPVHIATATSQAILCAMALTGTIVHVAEGNLQANVSTAAMLGVGAIIGAQIGARVSTKLKGSGIIQALALALGVVGLRILLMGKR